VLTKKPLGPTDRGVGQLHPLVRLGIRYVGQDAIDLHAQGTELVTQGGPADAKHLAGSALMPLSVPQHLSQQDALHRPPGLLVLRLVSALVAGLAFVAPQAVALVAGWPS
jgi:hypothetical protein